MPDDVWVPFGRVGRPHGVRGEMRLFPFHAASPLLQRKAPWGVRLELEGRTLDARVLKVRQRPRDVLLTLEGVGALEQAALWTGATLAVLSSLFPAVEEPDEWYAWQLEGLRAVSPEGEEVGLVRAVVDHGAGDLVVVKLAPSKGSGEVVLPFAEPWVGEVRLQEGTLVVDQLEDFLE